MKKFKNITIGGIQQKIFNLVLITLLLMVAAYIVVILHQSGQLTGLVNETNAAQKASIANISEWTMHEILDSNLTQSSQLEAYIAGELFSSAADTVLIRSGWTTARPCTRAHSSTLKTPRVSVAVVTTASAPMASAIRRASAFAPPRCPDASWMV